MKILITGGSGQLGTDVTLLLKECCEVFFLTRVKNWISLINSQFIIK